MRHLTIEYSQPEKRSDEGFPGHLMEIFQRKKLASGCQ